MASTISQLGRMASASARIIRRAMAIGENRLALLAIELQEGVQRFALTLLIVLLISVCALLALITASAAVVVIAWPVCPITALLLLTAAYLITAAILYRRLMRSWRAWHPLAASLDQLRKDRACLDHMLD